jgi:trehalose 6-phosphate synthase/phosphatase
MSPGAHVLIVSNRLPVTARWASGEVRLHRSVGGLASALRPIHESGNATWFGTVGDVPRRRREQSDLRRELGVLRCVPVYLPRAESRMFYEEVSNGMIWPLFHDRLDRLPAALDGWDTYERVNGRFADAVAEQWREGDVIWVHDYHLLRLPALLRERLPSARIGFFLHIPFPNPEMFLALPFRREVVTGLLGADVIGFHTRRYRGHFTAAVRRLLGLEMDGDSHLRHAGGRSRLGIYPIGVDAAALNDLAVTREVTQRVLAHRARHERLLLGVDRLDYTKGIARKLQAFERLLAEHPEHRGHVRLLQLAVPSREGVEAYQSFRREVEMAVTRINGRYATPSWTPIQYLHQAISPEELVALYRAADVMLVTPLRDGMNLVAKEFAATRSDEAGCLILSEFAGAADELTDALIVNPYDLDGVAQAMQRALTMNATERRRRMRALRAQVFDRNVYRWATDFLQDLGATAPAIAPFHTPMVQMSASSDLTTMR